MAFLENEFFLLALTFVVFLLAKILQEKTGWLLLNPILVCIVLLIVFLKLTGIRQVIDFWLKPAVVALGVPLYLQLESIRKQIIPILMSQMAGCAVGVISVSLIAKWAGASQEVIVSLAAKSVTTPIAIEVTETLGGIPALTAAIVICVGLFGAAAGFKVLTWIHVDSPMAQGLSMGTASHAVGTATAMSRSPKYGAFASLGLTMNGILTALLTPLILEWIGVI